MTDNVDVRKQSHITNAYLQPGFSAVHVYSVGVHVVAGMGDLLVLVQLSADSSVQTHYVPLNLEFSVVFWLPFAEMIKLSRF